MNGAAPVGIFDSGVGGLSVAREIRRILPGEDLLYLADSAHCPYGGRPIEQIRERSLAIGRLLVGRGAKLLVVACNSASGAALETLRSELTVPVVGMEPAVKPAAASSRNRRIGVMATAATLSADRFDRLMRAHATDVEVVAQACPGLVELVESGEISGDRVHPMLEELLEPFRRKAVDTVVLGCTHYPFLDTAIREVLGPDVTLIDTGPAVARQTERVLRDQGLLASGTGGSIRVLTTGSAAAVASVVARLCGEAVPVEEVTA